jgi:hypothetical protein
MYASLSVANRINPKQAPQNKIAEKMKLSLRFILFIIRLNTSKVDAAIIALKS